MKGDYTGALYRNLRAQFREDCRRNRRPCSICGQPIDYSLTFPNKWAWELHHLKPTSQHPHLHYVQANWGASHSRCNKSQSAKPRQEWVVPPW
jgi:5-methylcytosine-specific restriction endonuclease McrA